MPEFKDYYAVLGVSPDADAQAIQQAYRKLARQHHPDVNPGDKAAEERFKEINEAYQAISDPERRKKYDALRQQYQQWERQGGSRGGFNWDAWQAEPGSSGARPGGQYTYSRTVSPEDMQDIFGDADPFSDFFSSLFGERATAGRASRAQRAPDRAPARGRDQEVPVEVTLEEAFRGATRTIQIGDRRIEAKIPPGVRTGSRVRLAGQGGTGVAGGSTGDLYLVIEVAPHPQFERASDDHWDDLRVIVPVDIYTAATGGTVRVPTLDGSVQLKIPRRTQADRVFRLKGKGMPRLETPTERGNLYAKVKLVLPEPLSDQEVETLRSLAQARRASETKR